MKAQLAFVILILCGSVVHVSTDGTTTATPTVTSATNLDSSSSNDAAASATLSAITTQSTIASSGQSPVSSPSSESSNVTTSEDISVNNDTEDTNVTPNSVQMQTDQGGTLAPTNNGTSGSSNCQGVASDVDKLLCDGTLSCVVLQYHNTSDLGDFSHDQMCPCPGDQPQYKQFVGQDWVCFMVWSTGASPPTSCTCHGSLGSNPGDVEEKQEDDHTARNIAVAVVLSFIGGVAVVVAIFLVRRMHANKQFCFREKVEASKAKWEGASNRVTKKILLKHSLQRERSNQTVNTNLMPESNGANEQETAASDKMLARQKENDAEIATKTEVATVNTENETMKESEPSDTKEDTNEAVKSNGLGNTAKITDSEDNKGVEQAALGDKLTLDSAKSLPDSITRVSELYEMDRDSVRGSTTSQNLVAIQNECFIVNNDSQF